MSLYVSIDKMGKMCHGVLRCEEMEELCHCVLGCEGIEEMCHCILECEGIKKKQKKHSRCDVMEEAVIVRWIVQMRVNEHKM